MCWRPEPEPEPVAGQGSRCKPAWPPVTQAWWPPVAACLKLTGAVIPVWLREPGLGAGLGLRAGPGAAAAGALVGDLSRGPRVYPRWLWATSPTVSGQEAGGDGPGLPSQGRHLAPGDSPDWCHKDPASGQTL